MMKDNKEMETDNTKEYTYKPYDGNYDNFFEGESQKSNREFYDHKKQEADFDAYYHNNNIISYQAKREDKLKKSIVLKLMTVFIVIGIVFEIFCCLLFGMHKNIKINDFISVLSFAMIINTIVIFLDAFIMYAKTKIIKLNIFAMGYLICCYAANEYFNGLKNALFWFLMIVMKIIYLLVRKKIRGKPTVKFKIFAAFFLIITFIPAVHMNMKARNIYTYQYKYSLTMMKFLTYQCKEGDLNQVDWILEKYLNNYHYQILKEDDEFLYVQVSGDSRIVISSIVTAKQNMSPNTELYFKVKKKDGSNEITGLTINHKKYDIYAQLVWDTLWEK